MGATQGGASSFDFNPRPREGGDGSAEVYVLPLQGISIHAPARGATKKDLTTQIQGAEGFQSTPPRGGRRQRRKGF